MIEQADIGKISQSGALKWVGEKVATAHPEIFFIPFVTLGGKGFLAGCIDLACGELGLAHIGQDDVFDTEGQAKIRACNIAREAGADTDRTMLKR